jgi:hypothetical protein
MSPLSRTDLIAGAAGWFCFGLALQAVWGRLPWLWLAVTMLAIPLRLSIGGRVVTKGDVLGAAIGLLLWIVIRDRSRLPVGCVLMGIAIVWRELGPFRFPGPAHEFSWVPFGASLEGDASRSAVVLLQKAFEYGSMVWLLRGVKLSYWKAGAVVASSLAAMEVAQCWMPGRSPEITDALLAVLMTVALRVLG